MKRGLQKTYIFGNLLPFIHDLCAINDHLEFDKNYKDTYTYYIFELQKESISISEASLSIIFENKKFKIKLFDK